MHPRIAIDFRRVGWNRSVIRTKHAVAEDATVSFVVIDLDDSLAVRAGVQREGKIHFLRVFIKRIITRRRNIPSLGPFQPP